MRSLSLPRWSSRAAALLLCSVGIAFAQTQKATADDGIFPPAAAAKPFIDFDGRGFLINGKREFIVSGSLHYPRVPRALWRDRLLRFKRAGFNTVQTYLFWNYHETSEGHFDFSGEKDIDAFFKLAKSLGMYVVARPGPYVRAEWDSGGYPVWLRFKPGVRVREDNTAYLTANDRWYDKVLPIIAANQINRGGAVIMVQLENEHPQGWGREMPNAYFTHLRDKAIALGIQVPYFFSGLHHGSDPGGENPWDSKGRVNPWYSTEFWPGWYNLYGPLDAGGLRRFDRGAWKIVAYGGNGYNFYMLHGGTNFDYANNDEDASSYDYGAAVGQAGDLRPIYYRFKRSATFARSFSSVLENSENASDEYKSAATNTDIRGTARRSPSGTILFLDNNGKDAVSTQVKIGDATYPSAGPMTLTAGEIAPVVLNYQLTPKVKLDVCAARILGIAEQGNITTLVIHGAPGEAAELRFDGGVGSFVARQTGYTTQGGRFLTLKTTFPATEVQEHLFSTGGRAIRILAVSSEMADRTWFINEGGREFVVSGPSYIGETKLTKAGLQISAEQPMSGASSTLISIFEPDKAASKALMMPASLAAKSFAPPQLSNWTMRRASETQPSFNDAAWKSTLTPLQMGADGDSSAYAWYRTNLRVAAAGDYRLNFSDAGDWLAAFIDGRPAGKSAVKPRGGSAVRVTLPLNLTAGQHSLTVLTAHMGRPKLFGYLGPIDRIEAKGLNGPVALLKGAAPAAIQGNALTDWHFKMDTRGDAAASELSAPTLDTHADGWQALPQFRDIFEHRKGVAWYRASLPELAVPTGARRVLNIESADDNATVYLNGQKLLSHEGWGEAFEVPLETAWKVGGPNIVAIRVENNDGAGGLSGAVTLAADATAAAGSQAIENWKMHGGAGNANAKDGWQPLMTTAASPANAANAAAMPTWYRTEFNATPPRENGAHPIWRVSVKGMTRGFVWLNGHNLGRYPEKVPVEGIYLPEPWLHAGRNTLTIFDEEGAAPQQVRLITEEAASRSVVALKP